MTDTSSPQPRSATRWLILVSGIALAVRLVHYRQSLWCDEMTCLLDYISGPWAKIVAPAPGEFTPNDHLLFALLAKVCLSLGRWLAGPLTYAQAADWIRLPSLVSGAITPLALAGPLRKSAPGLSIGVALAAALNPWLVAFSDEARGYALMILLGILATNVLLKAARRWPLYYSFLISAMLYTVSVSVFLILAHAVYIVVARRQLAAGWFRGILMASLWMVLLFLPVSGGILHYIQHPPPGPGDTIDFLNQLPRFALAGQYVPGGFDPLNHAPDPTLGWICWLAPMLILTAGFITARRRSPLKPMLGVMACASGLLVMGAIVFPQTGQVRFAPWCAIWLILSTVSICARLRPLLGRPLTLILCAIAAGIWLIQDVALLPSQPVRDAMLQADAAAPHDAVIVLALLTADESAKIYGPPMIRNHPLRVAGDPRSFAGIERQVFQETGRRPWVILSYEYMTHEMRPDFWSYFQARYQLEVRLPGRISPVAVYRPR